MHPYEQYPGEYASSFASDLGWLASVLIALPDIDKPLVEDIVINSDLIREIETSNNPALANSTFYTWLAMLKRESRYESILARIGRDEIKAAVTAPTCWSIWWAVETAARIAQRENIRIGEALDIISLDELDEKFYPGMHTLPLAKMFEIYDKRTGKIHVEH